MGLMAAVASPVAAGSNWIRPTGPSASLRIDTVAVCRDR